MAAVVVLTGIFERPPTPTLPNPLTAEWDDVTAWESSGDYDSPPFHIQAEIWRVTWVAPHDSVGDGSFAVHVYNPDGLFLLNLYDTANDPERNFDGPFRGSLGLPGPGDYFLRIITDRDYQVKIQEQR